MQMCRIQLFTTMMFAFLLIHHVALSQPDPNPAKMHQRIEEMRKIKLLDVLNLNDDQVEKFFAVYNKHQKNHEMLRKDIDRRSKELQAMIDKGSTDAELAPVVEELRQAIRNMGKSIDARFDEARAVLTPKQYAAYVVFEARFRDELQNLILNRLRKHKR